MSCAHLIKFENGYVKGTKKKTPNEIMKQILCYLFCVFLKRQCSLSAAVKAKRIQQRRKNIHNRYFVSMRMGESHNIHEHKHGILFHIHYI